MTQNMKNFAKFLITATGTAALIVPAIPALAGTDAPAQSPSPAASPTPAPSASPTATPVASKPKEPQDIGIDIAGLRR